MDGLLRTLVYERNKWFIRSYFYYIRRDLRKIYGGLQEHIKMLYNTTIQLTPSEFHALTSKSFCIGNYTGECLPKSRLEEDLLEYIDESTEGRIYIRKLLELTPGGHLIWVKDPPTPQKLREDYFRLMEVSKKAELGNYVGSLLIAMRKFYFDEKPPDEYVFVDSLGDLLNAAVRSGFE